MGEVIYVCDGGDNVGKCDDEDKRLLEALGNSDVNSSDESNRSKKISDPDTTSEDDEEGGFLAKGTDLSRCNDPLLFLEKSSNL